MNYDPIDFLLLANTSSKQIRIHTNAKKQVFQYKFNWELHFFPFRIFNINFENTAILSLKGPTLKL